MFRLKVIETGSSGNCFLFNETLIIDMGLPMSRLKDKVDFQKVTHILLTHIHSDHFNKTTLSKIFNDYPHITFVCGEWLREDLRLVFGGKLDRVEVIEMNKLYEFGEFKVAGFHATHDVPNCGYRLVDSDGHKHIHVTDISTLDGLTAINYDSATIECNYEDNKAIEINIFKHDNDEYSHLFKAMKNHLSVYDVIEFVKENDIKSLTPVHIGKSTRTEVSKALRDAFEN